MFLLVKGEDPRVLYFESQVDNAEVFKDEGIIISVNILEVVL